ncbi:hypothetical protein [Raoultella sp. R2A007]
MLRTCPGYQTTRPVARARRICAAPGNIAGLSVTDEYGKLKTRQHESAMG